MLATALAFTQTAEARADVKAGSSQSHRIADRRDVALLELLGRNGATLSRQGLSAARGDREAETRRREIELLLREMSSAYQHRDLAVAAALVDFPLVFLRAASGGWVRSLTWSNEEWLGVVESRFNGAPALEGRHVPVISMITDSLAWVEDDRVSIAQAARDDGTHELRLALVIRRGRRWLVKAFVERRATSGDVGAGAHIGGCASGPGSRAGVDSKRRPCLSR